MVKSEDLRVELVQVLKQEFPQTVIISRILKSGRIRYSLYFPNRIRKKRWMQIDTNEKYLSIAMDHSAGDISIEDLNTLGLPYGLNRQKSAVKIQNNNDAVNFSIFVNDHYSFDNDNFKVFLHKHYASYKKLLI